MLRIIVCLLSLCCTTLPIAAEDLVKSFALGDLTLPAGTVTEHMRISDIAVAGTGEAVIDNQGTAQQVLIRLPAAGAVRGVVLLDVTQVPDAALQAAPVAVLPASTPPPKPAYVHFTISAAAFAAAPDGSARMRTVQISTFSGWTSNRLGTGIFPESIDRGSRAWWSMRLHRIEPGAKAGDGAARRPLPDALDQSIDLVTGLTALNENLQFDRRLAISGGGEATVAITSLPELQTKEIPWARMAGASPSDAPPADLLSQHIQASQYALLFPSFTALVSSLAQADAMLSGPLELLTGHGEDAGTLSRYQRQLGLELTDLSKRFGAEVIDQLAVTGSDPFLRVGSDVAIILHAKQPALLAAYLALRQQALVAGGGVASTGSTGATNWTAVINADRSLCSYVAADGDIALITNSLSQVAAYEAVRTHGDRALSHAPDYAFFRHRYHQDGAELALAIVSDAALRQWCSARCRIGDSRRTRAQAVLANLQAEWIAAGCPATWTPSDAPTDLGAITIGPDGVHTSIYGSLAFMTPISELSIDRVTAGEAEAYKRFIDRYQRSWRDFLDPIAIHLETTSTGRLAVDISVLPLIVSSEYRTVLQVANKATLQPGAADGHAAGFQLAIAIDHQGKPMVDLEHSVGGLLGGIVSPLGWVGNAASIYADPDPVWEELTHMADQRGNFSWIQDNLARIPIGINIAVSDQLKLAAFLVGLKSMSETAAPGMLVWGTHAWKDVTYVVVSPSAAGRGQIPTDLYYLAAAEGLTITLDETVMQHAIERLVARRAALAAGGAGGLRPWVGDQVSAVMRPLFLAQLSAFEPNGGVSTWMYARMWNDVAILNEWHRLFPDQDPLAVHERLWKTRLVCPFGGTYRWNEDHLSMEATAVDPITDDAKTVVPAAFAGIASLSAGFGIEPLPALDVDAPPAKAGPHVARDMNDRSISIGLRARIEVESAAAK